MSNIKNEDEYPLISIVMPSFNHERYIEECLDSIKSDPYPNIEVLIMDDGSIDNTFIVAEQWRLKNNSCFARFSLSKQDNKGVAITVNELITKSLGDFIIPLASDDKLIPGALINRLNFFKNNNKCLALISDCRVIDENSHEIYSSGLFDFRKSDKYAYQSVQTLNNELIMNWVLPGPVVMFRKGLFFGSERIGLYDESGATEDREMFLRLILNNCLYYADIAVSQYRIHSNNSCRPVSKKQKLTHYKMRLKGELRHIYLFSGIQKIFLSLSSYRYSLIVERLENNKNSLLFLEILIGIFM